MTITKEQIDKWWATTGNCATVREQIERLTQLAYEAGKSAVSDLIPQDALFVSGQYGANVTRVRLESAVSEPVEWPKDREFLSKKQIDSIVYLCREDGADTTYDIVNTAIQYYTDTTPPAEAKQPLTQDQIYDLFKQHLHVSDVDGYSIHGAWDFARAIEAAHGIGAKE